MLLYVQLSQISLLDRRPITFIKKYLYAPNRKVWRASNGVILKPNIQQVLWILSARFKIIHTDANPNPIRVENCQLLLSHRNYECASSQFPLNIAVLIEYVVASVP